MDLPLEAQANARKERLAKLRGMKRKQQDEEAADPATSLDSRETGAIDASAVVLSGRNYDLETKAPKLGYDLAPSENLETLEAQAASIAIETRKAINDEDTADKTIDLLSLQPKKPNWDLKRDVDQKLVRLERLTDNAVARILRDRILQSQAAAGSANPENLAELVRQREKEEEKEEEEEEG
ncbi:Pre-mRNA-splicing factor [Drechslerella dactyloides]|uniref:Pre-mRNA-splicing factor n=1 Tax=Drechslerella dactyloides TaxID=74499 RepID=A0AAD6J4G3_DREDA|nr:Pre-mRNA-splicing factor [Drechslerella dactyloides]